jgi:hypothetical protein
MHCGSSSSSDGDVGYVLQPGGATYYATGSGYDITFDAQPDGDYAIIYSGTVNNTDIVGISASNDPTSNTAFNLKIHFPSTGIPGSTTINPSTGTIKVFDGTNTYTLDDTVTLTVTDTGSNNIYSIKTNPDKDSISMSGAKTLIINEIKAILVSQ